MNAVSSTQAAEQAGPRAAARPLGERLLAVLPLLGVYIVLCGVYLVEAWQRVTPWLFGDELQLTQLARGIADSGHPSQRGQAMPIHSLYTVVTAPVWLIHDVPTAYAGVKYLGVFLMTSAVFPTYFLARLLVGRRAALFAAAGAGAIPALAYTGYVVEENLAYPYAALCFFLIAKALVETRSGRPAWRWVVAATLACLIAPLARGELGVVVAVGAMAAVFTVWSSDWARQRRRDWSTGDWVGLTALVLGAVFTISAVGSQESFAWLVATRIYKHRMINMTGWAAGSLAIGMGVVPLAAGLAALVGVRGETRSRELRAFRSLTLAALIGFGAYTAIKAAYLSYGFATRVEERNLIYIAPLLLVGTALALERRRLNPWALLASSAFAAYLVGYALYHPTQFPYEMNVQLYSDALGLAILQEANRVLYWTPDTARWVLLAIAVAGAAALAALPRLRPRAAALLAGALAVGVVGWSLTGELSAAAGSNRTGREFGATLRHPFSWVDGATGGAPTLFLGEGETTPNITENLLEFWNRSIARVSSLDGTIGGPGPAGGPNIAGGGRVYWTGSVAQAGPTYDYAVEDYPCVDLAGRVAATHPYNAGGTTKIWRLVQLTHPNRLRGMCTGIYPDGWSGATDSAYFRFSGGKGWLRIVVSRRNWGGASGPSPVHVLYGKLVINSNDQPILGPLSFQRNLTIDSTQTKTVWVRSPASRFAVHVVVDKKFVPHDYVPTSGDLRELGAQITYTFFAKLPKNVKR